MINCGRGPDILRFAVEFSGVLVLGDGADLDLKQPGVVARSGLSERLPSDPLGKTRVYCHFHSYLAKVSHHLE